MNIGQNVASTSMTIILTVMIVPAVPLSSQKEAKSMNATINATKNMKSDEYHIQFCSPDVSLSVPIHKTVLFTGR